MFEFVCEIFGKSALRELVNICRNGLGQLSQFGGFLMKLGRVKLLCLWRGGRVKHKGVLGNFELSRCLG